MLSGRANPEATASYAARFSNLPGNFRPMHKLSASSAGMGTYLGETDEKTDKLYCEAAKLSLISGINVIDTAVNYRFQLSERSIGAAIRQVVDTGQIRREEIIVGTKGGYITFDGGMPANPRAWFEENLVETGLIGPGDLVEDSHCMTPRYIDAMIDTSRRNLGLETLDVYFLHNPETQLPVVGRDEFKKRMRLAFELLEQRVAQGHLVTYGAATWNGFRVESRSPDYLSLPDLVALAKEAGGVDHHFGVIQVPYNLAMPEALTLHNQPLANVQQPVCLLEAAQHLGVAVWASASLLQGRLTASLPPIVAEAMGGLDTNAQRSLQFVRSTPGVNVALIGMKSVAHVRENIAALNRPPAPLQSFMKLFDTRQQ